MQAMLHLLHHYRLTNLHVHLLQVEKDLVFLQHPTEVGKLFGPQTRCVRLGKVILLDGIGMDTASVTFSAHLPKHVHAKDTNPSSHATAAPSRLSSSLS
jgi:hypothetical protein